MSIVLRTETTTLNGKRVKHSCAEGGIDTKLSPDTEGPQYDPLEYNGGATFNVALHRRICRETTPTTYSEGPSTTLNMQHEHNPNLADDVDTLERLVCSTDTKITKLLVDGQRQLNDAKHWTRVARVNADMLVRTRRFPPKVYRQEGSFFVPIHWARGVSPATRPFPLNHQVPVTTTPRRPVHPTDALRHAVKSQLRTWRDCLTPQAWHKLYEAIDRKDGDEQHRSMHTQYRVRSAIGREDCEIRISPEAYHPVVRAVLHAGFTIRIAQDGTPGICIQERLRPEAFAFNAEKLRKFALRDKWSDKELIFALEGGFADYSQATPSVFSFSPHPVKAYRDGNQFKLNVQKEIAAGWMSEATAFPPSIPFQVHPGSLELKKDGSRRLVWNGSWPKPGTTYSMLQESNGQWHSISSNSNTVLPQDLIREWVAIESNNEIIDVMASGARVSSSVSHCSDADMICGSGLGRCLWQPQSYGNA